MSQVRTPHQPAVLRARIAALAARPTGVTWRHARDIAQHCDRPTARVEFDRLAPTLHSRPDGRYTRYFASAADAAAWVRPVAPVRKPTRPPRQPAPAAVAAHAGPRVVLAAGWTHDPRYQLAPGERVVGGFATLGMGRYLDE